MFEVRCVVGDKKLSEVLRSLQGSTLEPPVVIPVDEPVSPSTAVGPNGDEPKANRGPYKAKKKYRKPVQHGGKHLKGSGSTQIARDLIVNSGVDRITAREMSQACLAAGYSKGAYSHAIKRLMEEKLIRPVPNSFGDYVVLKPASTTTSTPAHEAIQHG